jgi:hypothetical protein
VSLESLGSEREQLSQFPCIKAAPARGGHFLSVALAIGSANGLEAFSDHEDFERYSCSPIKFFAYIEPLHRTENFPLLPSATLRSAAASLRFGWVLIKAYLLNMGLTFD